MLVADLITNPVFRTFDCSKKITDDGLYLCLPQQANGEGQPVRTAGLHLQGDESQGQHGSFELHKHLEKHLELELWMFFVGIWDLYFSLLNNYRGAEFQCVYLLECVVSQTVVESACEQGEMLRAVESQQVQKPRSTR